MPVIFGRSGHFRPVSNSTIFDSAIFGSANFRSAVFGQFRYRLFSAIIVYLIWPVQPFIGLLPFLVIIDHRSFLTEYLTRTCVLHHVLDQKIWRPLFLIFVLLFSFGSSCQTISYFVSYNESENLKTSADPCKSCKRQLKRLKFELFVKRTEESDFLYCQFHF